MHDYEHDGPHHKSVRENRKQILHLSAYSVAYQPARVVCVVYQTQQRGHYLAVAHGHKPERNRDAQHDHALYLLYHLQFQKEVRTPLDLQKVEVDGMDGVPHHCKADDLQQVDRPFPFVSQDDSDERVCHRRKPRHEREDDERRHLEDSSVRSGKTLRLVLDGAQDRESDTLQHARDV